MNSFSLSFILLFACSITTTTAQKNDYALVTDSLVYEPLVNGTLVSNQGSQQGSKQLSVKLPFKFNYSGRTENSLNIGSTGFISFGNSPYSNILAFNNLSDGINAENYLLPEIRTLYTKEEEEGIFKIEMKYVFTNTTKNNCFNYQVWLYESSGKIAFHIGPLTYAFIKNDFLKPEKFSPSFPGVLDQKIKTAVTNETKNRQPAFPTGMVLSSGNSDLTYLNDIPIYSITYTFTPLFNFK
ncbi:MAG TPA: hypothetical protein VLB84_16530 [Bacteroidia bacterium]|nr:hypothetical protein [Bacteroidia bacterium]